MAADFGTAYERGYLPVLRAVRLLTTTSEDAHDLVQEAFARAYARWDRVGTLEDPRGWVVHVAVNAAIDRQRRERRRRRAYLRWGGRLEPSPAPTDAVVEVSRALARLPERQRAVVVLHHLCDLPVDVVAGLLDVPVGTVKTRLARGRAALAAMLTTEERTHV